MITWNHLRSCLCSTASLQSEWLPGITWNHVCVALQVYSLNDYQGYVTLYCPTKGSFLFIIAFKLKKLQTTILFTAFIFSLQCPTNDYLWLPCSTSQTIGTNQWNHAVGFSQTIGAKQWVYRKRLAQTIWVINLLTTVQVYSRIQGPGPIQYCTLYSTCATARGSSEKTVITKVFWFLSPPVCLCSSRYFLLLSVSDFAGYICVPHSPSDHLPQFFTFPPRLFPRSETLCATCILHLRKSMINSLRRCKNTRKILQI